MKKVDEMERNIKLRSEELGYKVAVMVLAIWTLYENICIHCNYSYYWYLYIICNRLRAVRVGK